MAIHQFAIRHCRYVRLPQRQFLLLQSLVGIGARAALIPPLELGSTQRRADFGVGALQSRFRGSVFEWEEPGLEEG